VTRTTSVLRYGRQLASVATLLALIALAAAVPAAARTRAADTASQTKAAAQPVAPSGGTRTAAVASQDRTSVLGSHWQSSTDRAWTTTGDVEGFHLLVADAKAGYAWRNAATLREPGFDADQWIGNACVTGSGKRAVVVYAPRTFTNRTELFARGGFTAVVNLDTGEVRKLPLQASLAYYNPGCGVGETAVLTQSGDETVPGTRLVQVDAAKATVTAPLHVAGQITSAIPMDHGAMAAAAGAHVIRIAKNGKRHTLAATAAVPFELAADKDGGVVYLDRVKETSTVRRVTARSGAAGPEESSVLATGPLTGVGLTSAANGSVFITGTAARPAATLPASVRALPVARDARASTTGLSAVLSTRWSDVKDSREQAEPGAARPVDIDMKVVNTGRSVGFSVDPLAGTSAKHEQGIQSSPLSLGSATSDPLSLGSATSDAAGKATSKAAGSASSSGESSVKLAALTGSATSAVEDERYCSIPRNDPRNQAFQPKPRQVEWAVDQAITNNLDSLIRRPADWKNLGMAAYLPQALFPRVDLEGGGRVPAQIMLGVAAQESNLWMSSQAAVPGETGNPLVGNFYGRDIYNKNADGTPKTDDDWDIRWDKADCGYGITQLTDHMRLAGREKGPEDKAFAFSTQRAVALDYAANIAAGLQILATKWNQTRRAGMIVNNGDASKMENWFFALWAYNTGFHPQSEASQNDGAWGVGWANNPINPEYKANREAFMEYTYSDAAHPQDWPYPEKVIGFAGHPPDLLESPDTMVSGYRAAWWNGDATMGPINRAKAKPPVAQFCDGTNQCEPGALHKPNAPGVDTAKPGPCAHKNPAGQFDLKCWYNRASTWKGDCSYSCGNEVLRFDTTYGEEADGRPYPPNCSLSGLPAGAQIIDDVQDGTPSTRPNCSRAWNNAGTFDWTFAQDSNGLFPSKVDLHQISGGFGGHFFFGHSRKSTANGGKLKITGTWTLNAPRNGWSRILVHLPDHGAHSQQARYDIDTGTNTFSRHRYINQRRKSNSWVSLGSYKLTGTPKVRLSTETEDGTGDDDVAFDAVAFQALPGRPKNIVAVLGDSYTSGEGVGNYYPETDTSHGSERWNACRRSKDAWARRLTMPGTSTPLGQLADAWDNDVELGFVACSGARNYNVWDEAYGQHEQAYREGQFREQKQARSGVLSGDTTLVMLTLGGNDGAAFVNAVQDCSGITDCSLDSGYLPKYKKLTDNMINDLRITLNDIAREAQNAQIVLMGYPELLSRTVKCAGSVWIDATEADALAQLANYVDTKQKDLVDELHAGTAKVKISYANPVNDFVGHAGCDSAPWINIIVSGPQGDSDFHNGDPASPFCISLTTTCLSRASFHPKKEGTGDPGYAGVMRKQLVAIGYPPP